MPPKNCIENSDSPLVNEQIKRDAQLKENRIELDFEMTEEQKLQEQSLEFGASNVKQLDGIGNGLNSTAKQEEFVRYRQSKQSKPLKQSQDLLDLIDENEKTPVKETKKSAKKEDSSSKKKAPPLQKGQGRLDNFFKSCTPASAKNVSSQK